MEEYNEFKHIVGGYYGIQSIEDYDIKFYILKEVENYIKEYIEEYQLNVDYKEEMDKINKELSLRVKLQDALDVLQKINGPLELTLIINRKLKETK